MLLATAVAAWLAAVIVGAALVLVAAVVALVGKEQIDRATPALPQQAKTSVRRDIDVVKESARR